MAQKESRQKPLDDAPSGKQELDWRLAQAVSEAADRVRVRVAKAITERLASSN
jgi:hypothetical protein